MPAAAGICRTPSVVRKDWALRARRWSVCRYFMNCFDTRINEIVKTRAV
jgi:hypothetical protein